MNRRQFVTNLFGTAGAVYALQKLAPFASAAELEARVDAPQLWAPVYDVTLEEFKRLFDQGYRDYLGASYFYDERQAREFRLGDYTLSGNLIQHQLNVAFGPRDLEDRTGRYLPAAAQALGVGAAQRAIGEFADLPLPHGLTFAKRLGPVRMVCAYNAVGQPPDYEPGYIVRFDVLGAKTPQAQVASERARQARLKIRIKERLLISEGTAMRLPA